MINPSEISEEQRKQWEEKIKQMSPEELKELQQQQCVFCQIAAEKVPSKKVYEDAVCIAAMDIAPASRGHLLIVPKEHYTIMPQVPDQVLGHVMVIAKRLSQIMLKALKVTGTNVFAANGAVAGQKAQHFFLHLIPRKEGDQVLNVEEKIISKELVQKVKAAVETRLLEITGMQKQQDEDFSKLPPAEEKITGFGKESTEFEEGKEASAPEPEQKSTAKSKRKTAKKKIKSENKIKLEDKNIEIKEEVPLDDIANLFK